MKFDYKRCCSCSCTTTKGWWVRPPDVVVLPFWIDRIHHINAWPMCRKKDKREAGWTMSIIHAARQHMSRKTQWQHPKGFSVLASRMTAEGCPPHNMDATYLKTSFLTCRSCTLFPQPPSNFYTSTAML
jgi:hypothetical protein